MLEKDVFLKRLEDIKKISEYASTLIDLGFDINSKIIEILFKSNNILVSSLENDMEDKYQTIDWFIFENDFGKKKYKIDHTKGKYAGTSFPFNNETDLYDYLTKYNNMV